MLHATSLATVVGPAGHGASPLTLSLAQRGHTADCGKGGLIEGHGTAAPSLSVPTLSLTEVTAGHCCAMQGSDG
jgi:hypothetical protein